MKRVRQAWAPAWVCLLLIAVSDVNAAESAAKPDSPKIDSKADSKAEGKPDGTKADSTKADGAGWLGEELPLPLTVKTPQDLALKAVAERQYLVFNLLARGKLAWDAGDFATAAAKWEALLRVPGVDPELEKVVKPLAAEARTRAGKGASLPVEKVESVVTQARETASGTPAPAIPVQPLVTVSGQVSGGGSLGPGGAVVWLKRTDGSTPRPAPLRGRSITQLNKTFIPRVLPVTVGTSVAFANEDPIFHNVFSLSRPNDFDSGLYKAGQAYSKSFSKPGPVQILCNIHASMLGYVVVVDTPWYGQADGSGSFVVKGVPPGEYDLETWHEGSSKTIHQRVAVGVDGLRGVVVRVGGDGRPPAAVPDKYGKQRQVQLGY